MKSHKTFIVLNIFTVVFVFVIIFLTNKDAEYSFKVRNKIEQMIKKNYTARHYTTQKKLATFVS